MRMERKSDHWMPLSSFRSPSLGIQCNAYFPCFSHCSTAPALSFELTFFDKFYLVCSLHVALCTRAYSRDLNQKECRFINCGGTILIFPFEPWFGNVAVWAL